ncbi:hypothetical protein FA95DRAFT_1607046 [Auriscalpium vulgare]|uniref:Uncharacterized protein n=1 Tax=Auriscalpium vulgare TaxID=40419 RepID=A0ACB8RR94_9AGAM|nr:hypothetical protein FA95DRAFT_1607046 [Auriscalpium vulgare]
MYAPGVPDNVADFTAPQLFGFLFNWGLFGVLSAQTYYYSLHFFADQRPLKSFVYGLYILEIVQTALITQTAFANFGKGWGDLDRLHDPGTMWFSVPLTSGLISAAVQSFFAYRIFVLTGSKLLRIVITVTAVLSGGAGVATAIVAHSMARSDSNIQATTFPVTLVWLVGGSLCDLVICICMLNWYLRSRRLGFLQETTDIMSQILRVSVATGLITAAVAAVDMTMFLVYKHNNFHMCPAIVLGKLYSNSFLVLLNNRYRITVNSRQIYLYDLGARASEIQFAPYGTGTVSIPDPSGTYTSSGVVNLVLTDGTDRDGSSSIGNRQGQQGVYETKRAAL